MLNDYKTYSSVGTDQEVRFITDVLNLPPASTILDLYCGYGRHAIELAKNGYQVTGLDATSDFLDIAAQKAQEAQVALQLRQCDMRELDYQEQFDAVINMFAAFGFFSDAENAKVIGLTAAALRSRGLFLIDLLNRDWMIHNNLNRYWRHPSGEYVLSYKVELQKSGITVMKRELTNQTTNMKTQHSFVLRAYSLPEITDILTQHQLTPLKIYGGFDGSAYSTKTPRMIILAQKDA